MERMDRFELSYSRRQRDVLPLNYTRKIGRGSGNRTHDFLAPKASAIGLSAIPQQSIDAGALLHIKDLLKRHNRHCLSSED